jgi:diguanylate cyclase (GGDEF)-like protein/putative nucleotidyltransferase with HDIG domain
LFAALVAVAQWDGENPLRLAFCLIFAVMTSKLKVRLPGIVGSMSVNYVFILMAILELPLAQAILVGMAANVAQSTLAAVSRPAPVQIAFNIANGTFCSMVAGLVYGSPWLRSLDASLPMMLFWTTVAYFLINTFAVAAIVGFTEGKPVPIIWYHNFFWTGPQYIFGAGFAGVLVASSRQWGWQYMVLLLPGIHLLYRSYHLYLAKLAEEKKHVSEVAELHLRTIEALALAIEAKDDTTHAHLRRVQVYALEIAREMGLPADEIRALEAAALLHDIGKLAVPEYIINKPGRLTREEFEKMKVHPIVGAEILECVQFPYPVVPIVRSHHEKWDGSGYPDGLVGEQIPVGARILTVVDCLDALASDRQYRKALPLEQALQQVVEQSGTSFDPRVVTILKNRCQELEAKARSAPTSLARLSTRAKVTRGEAPAAGLAESASVPAPPKPAVMDFISSIAAARSEFQMLHEATRDLGSSLSMQETFSLLATRLKALVPFDAIAVYCLDAEVLTAHYVEGENAELFGSLRIPYGEGLSGWVAQNHRPILNGNPAVETGYLNDPLKFTLLRSALAVPLETSSGTFGTLTLYRLDQEAFTKDHLRILLAINSKAALTIENALLHSTVERKVGTDPLTGLANAQALFHHLEKEIARTRNSQGSLSVMVLDLDGFKAVNDRFGHLEGNRVLVEMAAGLRSLTRDSDGVARMGGDEFTVVLPGIPAAMAEEKAQAFYRLAVDVGKRVTGEEILSLSWGLAHYPADGEDVEGLLDTADKRMYKTKRRHHAELAHLRTPARVVISDTARVQ